MHVLSIEIALAQLGGLIQISVFSCLIYFPEQATRRQRGETFRVFSGYGD